MVRQISIGDVLRASRELEVDIALVANLLGYEWTETRHKKENFEGPPIEAPLQKFGSEKKERGRRKEGEGAEQNRTRREAVIPGIELDDNDALAEPSSQSNRRFESEPRQLRDVRPLHDLKDEKIGEPPEIDSLLYPTWSRAILYGILTRVTHNGDIDHEKTVEVLAQCKQIDRYPCNRVKNLRAGVQLLIDVNKLMDPYAEDQRQILTQIKKQLLADIQIEELYFSACPINGAWRKDAADLYLPYRKPRRPGTPVVLLTDLCAGKGLYGNSSASPSEWLKFAGGLRVARCPLIALVPYPIHDIPVQLRRVIKVVHWDRSATTGTVERNIVNLI